MDELSLLTDGLPHPTPLSRSEQHQRHGHHALHWNQRRTFGVADRWTSLSQTPDKSWAERNHLIKANQSKPALRPEAHEPDYVNFLFA